MPQNKNFLSLDVGEKRIGVALGDGGIKIAVPFITIDADGTELTQIESIIAKEMIDIVVVGYPRNQSGQATAQTAYVEAFTERLRTIVDDIVFQDESLTSVLAEERLKSYKKPYSKADIDAQAAAIILQDYLERQ